MRVSLDGGLTWQVAPNGVRIIHNGLGRELLVNHTHEGVIIDVLEGGEVSATWGAMTEELIADIMEGVL